MTERHVGSPVRAILGVAAVLLLAIAALSGPAAAHTGDDGTHHHDGWMGTHDWMGGWVGPGLGLFWMLLWPIVLIGVPVALVYLLLRDREPGGGRSEDAREVLRRRYARGEIDDEEFEARRRTLQGRTE